MSKSTIAATIVRIVLIIARIQFKADPRKVVYLVRASNGTDQYEVSLFEGKATSCNCASRKPCKHMRVCEAKEAARQQFQQEATSKSEQREAALAKAREESAAYLAQIEREVLASIEAEQAQASRPRSEQARIADLDVPVVAKASTFQDLKARYDVRSEQRQTATLAGASRGFSLLK